MSIDKFLEIIDTRKTNRKYENYIPPSDDIKRIIESARLAPSAVNAQNWKFIAIYNQEIKEKMAKEVLDVYDKILSTGLEEDIKGKVERYRGHSTFFTNAPVVIVCILEQSVAFFDGILEKANYGEDEIRLMRPDSQLLSMGGAIENMALTAHALGLGSCWMAAPILAQEGFRKILNLNPNDRLISLLTIGKPADGEGKRSPKKSLEEICEIIV